MERTRAPKNLPAPIRTNLAMPVRTKAPENLNTYSQEQLVTFTNALINRASLAARLGQQYGGDRDIYQALGYPDTITFEDYAVKYARQDIARAIINRPVNYTWKGPLIITEVGTEEDTALEKEWKKLEKELRLKSKFVRLDKLSSIGNYGVLLLGFDDVRKTEEWQKPVEGKKRKLLYVKPLSQGSADIASYIKDPHDKRYGLVEHYNIELANPGADSTTTLMVHYSRVLHVTPELLESEVEGEPVLKSVYNRLLDMEKLVGGSAEMFWRGARPGYQAIVAKDATITPTVEAGLQEQIDEYEHNLRRMIVNQDVEYKALETQVKSPKDHVDVVIQMICAETGIPKRILTGSERGELASSQDESSWLNIIQTRREEHAEVNIIRPFVDLCIKYGVLPEPTTEEYQIEWLDLFAASDKDKAEVGKIRADALAVYAKDPMTQMIIPPNAFFDYFLGLDEDQREKIKEMSDAALEEEMKAIAEDLKARKAAGPIQDVEIIDDDEVPPVRTRKPATP